MTQSALIVLLALLCVSVSAQRVPETIPAPFVLQRGGFGSAVSSVPDLDRDGYDDIIIGASGMFGAVGRVFVFSGADRSLLYMIIPPIIEPGAFGSTVAGIPDIDGDGQGDLVVGAPYQNNGAYASGRAFVFSGAVGDPLFTLDSPVPEENGVFGWSVASVPDTNGDGLADILVGAWEETTGPGPTESEGHAYLFSGIDGSLLYALSGPRRGRFGWSVSGVSDVDDDGRGDLLVGAWAESTDQFLFEGRVYLYSGASGALIRSIGSPNPEYDGSFGYSVVGLPDLNGDGLGDLLIGASSEDTGGRFTLNGGRAYVFDGADGTLLNTLNPPYPEFNGIFGSTVSWVPDVDSDGILDLVVSAVHETETFHWAGRTHLFSGNSGNLLRTLVSPNPQRDGFFGDALAGLPDLDGDGLGELMVTAPLENEGAIMNSGHAYLFFSGIATSTAPIPDLSPALAIRSISPNPFSTSTTLHLILPFTTSVEVDVLDALGRRMALLHDGLLEAGDRSLSWEAADLPTGVYLVRIHTADGASASQRVTLVR